MLPTKMLPMFDCQTGMESKLSKQCLKKLNQGASLNLDFGNQNLYRKVVSQGDLQCMEMLIMRGIDMKGFLTIACNESKDDIAKLLLDNHADVEDCCDMLWQQTPLMISATKCDVKIVNLLLERKANPAITTQFGLNALHYLRRQTEFSPYDVRYDICQRLLEKAMTMTDKQNG